MRRISMIKSRVLAMCSLPGNVPFVEGADEGTRPGKHAESGGSEDPTRLGIENHLSAKMLALSRRGRCAHPQELLDRD